MPPTRSMLSFVSTLIHAGFSWGQTQGGEGSGCTSLGKKWEGVIELCLVGEEMGRKWEVNEMFFCQIGNFFSFFLIIMIMLLWEGNGKE